MSSTPEEGENGAPEDTLDLPEEAQLEDQLREGFTSQPDDGLLEVDEVEDSEQFRENDQVQEQDDATLDAESTSDHIADNGLREAVKNDSRGDVKDDLRSEDETISIPDDTPSVPGSVLSSPRSEAPSFLGPGARGSPSNLHRSFDRRFHSRLSSSPLNSPRAISPAFLNSHSRQSSVASIGFHGVPESDSTSTPWDVIRWTRLRKITAQAFSEVGKRKFGRPTSIAITTSIVIGTSKGIVLVFDYQQNHKGIVGMGTKAIECGAVTSLAISADHTTLAAGHAEGHIFTWEIARSAKPFLHIPPIDTSQPQARKVDGHVSGVAILHVGFLGYRHTALVSADDRGMAFSHLATRGMGAVARTVRTTRVLGRYPDVITRGPKPRKASSVMAFSPLPLGNIEQGTDGLGLVAMMTPYLLVIVSTTPIAQTQHKSARPKEVAAHSAMSAALAWFPAIKLKGDNSAESKTKLVYCWSNVLTILDVNVTEQSESAEKDKPPDLEFKPRNRWRSEEAIVAVQWLSRSVLAILTITQQLVILEDKSMHVADSFDLLQKQIFHTDLYSQQLNSLVEHLDEEDSSMHGVVADAFHMSFRAYKGRLFILGFNDVSIGSLSNWADRLLALMEAGDFIGAIRLATSYYTGEVEKLTIGLPEEDTSRHSVVQEKLLEMISASLKYAFGRNEQAGTVQVGKSQLTELATVCIAACVSVQDQDFLFDEIYTWYEDNDEANTFLDVLEPYIMDGKVISLPPATLKVLIDHFITTHTASKLEEIICLLDTSTIDIDQVTTLCKKYNLYDAYIYVWNKTLRDWTSPLEELLKMILEPITPNGHAGPAVLNHDNSQKIFPYLSFIWTGRTYPTGVSMDEEEANLAKKQIYDFFYSGRSQSPGSRKTRPETLAYPRLHEIISYDAASFISVLNEAFEDNFLNDESEEATNGSNDHENMQRKTMSRQYIVQVMLEVMTPTNFETEDTIFWNMFIARNLPKYPQDILLSGKILDQVLVKLCRFPSDDVADDCQLSVEYLLSVYHPPDLQTLIPLFREAKFYRVLRSIYRSEHQYSELIDTYFLTQEDQEGVFDTLLKCLKESSGLNPKQRLEVLDVVREHARDLALIDVQQTATTFDQVAPDMHDVFLQSLEHDNHSQYDYLRAIIESDGKATRQSALVERYVQLMCRYNPTHVADFVDGLKNGDLRLEQVLPSMESSGIIDAAVILLARQGQMKDAMDRLIKHLGSLEAALSGILLSAEESPDAVNTNEAIHDLLESITKYSGVGIWLCQTQSKSRFRQIPKSPKRTSATKQPLSFEEQLWLDLITTVVKIAKDVSPQTDASDDETALTTRAVVQHVFTALLTATTSRDGSVDRNDFSFLRILRSFLTHAATTSPSLAELRSVIGSIFSAYAYEESLLALANSMLDKDLFVHVDEIYKLRQKGWRPKGQICEVCRRRVWGPSTSPQIWDAWESKQQAELKRRTDTELDSENKLGKGKAAIVKAAEPDVMSADKGAWVQRMWVLNQSRMDMSI